MIATTLSERHVGRLRRLGESAECVLLRLLHVALALGVLVLVLGGIGGTSVAAAATPWWHLTSGSRPTYIRAGSARNEIQTLTVAGKAGEEYILADLTRQQIEKGELFRDPDETEPAFAILSVNAEASAVQASLEQIFGVGNVAVSGGPGNEAGTSPYTIEFRNDRADTAIAVLNTELTEESAGKAVTVAEVSHGQADGTVVVTATNIGDAPINGSKSPAVIADALPPGLKALGITGTRPAGESTINARPAIPCELTTLTCEITGTLQPFDAVEVSIPVVAQPGAESDGQNEVRVHGGGADDTAIRRGLILSDRPTPFGVEDYEMRPEEENGVVATQAGAHPFQLTTSITFNQTQDAQPAALLKDASFNLPPGLIGNPTAFPKCSTADFFTTLRSVENRCPASTAVGVALVTVNEPSTGLDEVTVPVFNLEPRNGEPARFGFYAVAGNAPVSIDTGLRTGEDYGITVKVTNVTQTAALLSSVVTFWGVPGDARHDDERGWGCLFAARGEAEHAPCNPANETRPAPFLSLPTSCSAALRSNVEADSWATPGQLVSFDAPILGEMDGCNRLSFSPSATVVPDSRATSSATGLSVAVHVPQDAAANAEGLAASAVREIAVTLPQGLTLNPAAAGGLLACPEQEFGYLFGQSAPPLDLRFTPTRGEPFCPEAAKIGTVTIRTPLLPRPLTGGVYLAEQGANPFGSLVAAYLFAEDSVSGTVVKLAGQVGLDEASGQVTTVFRNNPQLPFEDADIHFFDGARAPLSTPTGCGEYASTATFRPWSGGASIDSQTSFELVSGPYESACPGVLPFAPTLVAGTASSQAGAFSPLTAVISRDDGEQAVQSVRLNTPPGVSGILTGVKLCSAVQADAGTCEEASLIGHTDVSVGTGPDPFEVSGGKVFLTEGYKGSPFGLSIVTPAKAGPFDLGLVIVRAKIDIDPHTAELTVTSDAIPHILDGIPLQIRRIDVAIDRPRFTFNPTNCSAFAMRAAIGSVEGATMDAQGAFQASNCARLRFAPKFEVKTQGRTSKAAGASLSVRLTYPSGGIGTDANVASVKVQLPKQLPSRLTTLQQACTATVFEANPAACPSAANVGHAKVITPLLPVPLTGPAYLVSHGGEAFPDLTIVLQGYGVTIDLVGSTAIKHGVTTSTFKTTPDVPFNSFELTLPQGSHSVLAANANLCQSTLLMPTAFVAQNGVKLAQTTKIGVSGCRRSLTRAQKLARALRTCRRERRHSSRRATCERRARRSYGSRKHGKKQ